MKNFTLIVILLFSIQLNSKAQNSSVQANQFTLKVEHIEESNLLTWTSNREVNSSYYLIERSIDGKPFEIIGKIKAGSSTYSTTYYEFEDMAFENSSLTYRLSLVLMDGESITILNNVPQLGEDLTKVE
tara:strand:+ start:9834 stop:10220 length:387 start_codon:yes stop_codon:yes gene_type:complete